MRRARTCGGLTRVCWTTDHDPLWPLNLGQLQRMLVGAAPTQLEPKAKEHQSVVLKKFGIRGNWQAVSFGNGHGGADEGLS